MEYEAYKLREVIFDNRYRLERKRVSLESGLSTYEFIVHDIGHNALDISGFFRYYEIAGSSGSIEEQLHDIIAGRTNNASVLKRVADERKHYIYDEKVYLDVYGYEYTFKIDGIGPQAVKISIQVTYDEIASSNKPLESMLRDIINTLYSSSLDNERLINEIREKWETEEADKQKIRDAVLKEEEIKRQKQKELEDFLNS